MDMNEYALWVFAQDRLAEMRAEAERSNQVRAARPAARSVRVALSHALLWAGYRLLGVREVIKGALLPSVAAGSAFRSRWVGRGQGRSDSLLRR